MSAVVVRALPDAAPVGSAFRFPCYCCTSPAPLSSWPFSGCLSGMPGTLAARACGPRPVPLALVLLALLCCACLPGTAGVHTPGPSVHAPYLASGAQWLSGLMLGQHPSIDGHDRCCIPAGPGRPKPHRSRFCAQLLPATRCQLPAPPPQPQLDLLRGMAGHGPGRAAPCWRPDRPGRCPR